MIRTIATFMAAATWLIASDAAAQAYTLKFSGRILDGPLAGHSFSGLCTYDGSDGDAVTQRGPCRLVAASPNRKRPVPEDSSAHLMVAGNQRAVQITLGAAITLAGVKGVDKLPAYSSILFFDQPVSLFEPFPRPQSVSVSLMGAAASSTPDCLIYDILGPGVH